MQNYERDILWQLSEKLDRIIIPIVMRAQKKEKEFVLSKQLLRATTSIGANAAEGRVSQTRKDFILKMSIARKECSESLSWVKRLEIAKLLSPEEMENCTEVLMQIMKILNASIATAKEI
jgi:four helix bundle protein